jgi:hypothetical protein
MSKKKQEEEVLMNVKAIHLTTNEIIAEGSDGDEVIRKAEESGEEYILDFEANTNYNFVF